MICSAVIRPAVHDAGRALDVVVVAQDLVRYRFSMRMASVPFQSSKWMQHPGKTSCTAWTNSSTSSSSFSLGRRLLAQPEIKRISA